ncbi:Myophilin [Taenia crassiceps]|uniref:Transgelin n=1 Tax=Taenia crassiceps TaxID=6207 RepID=A0ABR4QKL2_9CEST
MLLLLPILEPTKPKAEDPVYREMNFKYNSDVEKEVLDWIGQLTGVNIEQGREKVAAALRDGEVLIKLVNSIYEGTPELPSSAANLRRPFKANTSKISFKMMENIETFVNACAAYGVPKTGLFQTVDLFEMRNMGQVINCIYQLGTECQRHNFNGPKCGPRPTYENKRTFSPEQLAISNTVIGLQAGFNKGASQKGMSMGAVRHIADIKTDNMTREGQSIIGLQAGSNKGASQSGMSIGAVRHIADMKIDPMSADGKTVIGLQAGSNKGASQSGMSMGSIRHVADIKTDDISESGKQVIGLQAGTNKMANQSGMSMAGIRHIADLKVGDISDDGKNVIGLQAGSNAGATQAGMSFGGRRDITNPT